MKLADHVAGTGHDDKVPAPSEEHDALVGRTIAGKYVIESRLGAGSMGAVYRARQTALDRDVAIKVMHAPFAADTAYAARFHLEAKAASRIDHPNLIRVHDYGQEPDGLLYIVMEYLDGRDLFTVLEEEWPLTHDRIVELLAQALSGLAEVHEAGVLHRDLKPENIMVLRRKGEDGSPVEVVKLGDFGIAKLIEPAGGTEGGAATKRRLTTAGLVVGTPEYMSPEQARGDPYDLRGDVYAVGVILYQLLTKRLPFEAKTAVEVVFKAIHGEPEPLTRPTAAPGLDAICLKAMNKRPEDRYENARAMHAALRSARVETGPRPPPDPVPARPRWAARGMLGAVALGAVAAAGIVLHQERRVFLPTTNVSAAAGSSVASVAVFPPPAPSEHVPLPSPSPAARPTAHEPARKPPLVSVEAEPSSPSPPPPPPTSIPVPSPSAIPMTPQPSPPPSTPPPPLPPQPSFNLATAKVEIGPVKSNSAATTSIGIGRALGPFAARFTTCYRNALAQGGPVDGEAVATLHLESDDEGYVTVARVTGAPSSAAARCIEALARDVRLQVDMGTADADVRLTFKPM